jgi:tRNA G37 N-methylase TrmD
MTKERLSKIDEDVFGGKDGRVMASEVPKPDRKR